MLIATRNILYQNRQYVRGDILPNYDTRLTKAWLESGSAIDKTDNAAEVTETSAVSVKSETSKEKPVKNTAVRKKK